MRQHQTIKARDLRTGDLMRLRSSTNYVLISSVLISGERVDVTVYNGDDPQLGSATIARGVDDDVELSGRGLGPNDRIEG